MVHAWFGCVQLKGLDLSNNRLSQLSCLSTLPQCAPSLVRLNLANNAVWPHFNTQSVQSLSAVMSCFCFMPLIFFYLILSFVC